MVLPSSLAGDAYETKYYAKKKKCFATLKYPTNVRVIINKEFLIL